MKKKIGISIGIFIIILIVIGIIIKYVDGSRVRTGHESKTNIISNIEVKPVDQFNLVFYQKTAIKPKQKEIIISKNEVEDVDYNVYSFEGNVAINLNSDSSELTENSISLREALLQSKITMEEIIEKAKKDSNENIITGYMYQDGGSMEYHYENYTIIKLNRLDGNKDIYIGTKDMTIHDLEINR